jgi:hypothetical protein
MTRINTILMNILSNIMSGIAIIQSANTLMVTFCLIVIALFLTNSSKCFLYSFVPLNQTSNLLDPLTKKKEANSNSGVVGSSGKITPNIPNPMNTKPKKIYKNFFNRTMIFTPYRSMQVASA